MMHFRNVNRTLCIVCNLIICCYAIGISSKLDFDSGSTSPKLIESVNKFRQVIDQVPKKSDINLKPNDNVGILCVSSHGCNVTETVNTNKDTIQTDVVVHVKTNVVIDNKTKGFTDDIPDVPIIIGTSTHRTSEDRNIIDDFQARTKEFPQIDFDPNIVSTPDIIKIPANFKPMNVPHFEGSYHRHHFGEHPPPAVVWYPKNDHKPTQAIWNPTTEKYHLGGGVTCTCKNEVPTGLQWYPRGRNAHHQPHIDDKLAPLV